MYNNDFIKADARGRKKALNYISTLTGITNQQYYLYESNNGFDRTDLSMTATTSANTTYVFEIECKDRYKYTSTSCDFRKGRRFENNDGAMIDATKYNEILDKAKKENKVPLYVMTYSDDVCLIWNLNNLKPEDIIEDYTVRPKNTIGDKGELKSSKCYFLNKQKAKVAYIGDAHLYDWNDRLIKAKAEYNNNLKLNNYER